MTPQQRERMVRLTEVYHLAQMGLKARAQLANNNKPVVFDELRENWDVWVRLSVLERAMWRAIQAVENQIRETWEVSDDLVKRLRATTDGATVNPDGPEAADRIGVLERLVQTAFGLLWHDKHNQARRHLADALTMDDRAKGIQMARDYDDKYKPEETPLPGPVGKAIEALEEAAKQSQWWAVDEDNDTSWIRFSTAAVMLTHWARGVGGEDAGKK